MKRTQYIQNDTQTIIYRGGVMISPGEGRDVDVTSIPAAELVDAAPAVELAQEKSLDELLQELRALSIAKILPDLPTLTREALDRLSLLEQEAAQPRKGLLTAIGDEILNRANATLKSDPGFGQDGDSTGDTDPDSNRS